MFSSTWMNQLAIQFVHRNMASSLSTRHLWMELCRWQQITTSASLICWDCEQFHCLKWLFWILIHFGQKNKHIPYAFTFHFLDMYFVSLSIFMLSTDKPVYLFCIVKYFKKNANLVTVCHSDFSFILWYQRNETSLQSTSMRMDEWKKYKKLYTQQIVLLLTTAVKTHSSNAMQTKTTDGITLFFVIRFILSANIFFANWLGFEQKKERKNKQTKHYFFFHWAKPNKMYRIRCKKAIIAFNSRKQVDIWPKISLWK